MILPAIVLRDTLSRNLGDTQMLIRFPREDCSHGLARVSPPFSEALYCGVRHLVDSRRIKARCSG